MKTYFALDGNYGDATDIVIIDTEKLTELDWNGIEEELDYYRAELAKEIERKYNV